MKHLTIMHEDIAPALATHTGNRIFSNTLNQIASSNDMLRVMGHYIYLS